MSRDEYLMDGSSLDLAEVKTVDLRNERVVFISNAVSFYNVKYSRFSTSLK